MVDSAQILLITAHRDDHVQGKIGARLEDLFSEAVDVAEYEELEFIIDVGGVKILWKDVEIGEYKKVVMYGSVSRMLRLTHPLALTLKARNIESFTAGAEHYLGVDKLSQGVLFSLNDIPIPKTYYASPENIVIKSGDIVGFPMIVKDILSSLGSNNYLIRNQAELTAKFKDMTEDRYMVQEYVENDGDIRVLINNKDDMFAYRRIAKPGSHLNNISAGGKAEKLDLISELMQDQCKKILHLMKLPLAGIDVIERDGHHYFLEANIQPIIFSGVLSSEKQKFLRETI